MVFYHLPKTLDDLKTNIEREIQKISKNILKSTILIFQKRREFIFNAENGHIEINSIYILICQKNSISLFFKISYLS